MATLHVRSVPDDLYEELRRRAAAEGRSINAEAIELLRAAASTRDRPRVTTTELLDGAGRIRKRDRRRGGSPGVVDMIRADRDR